MARETILEDETSGDGGGWNFPFLKTFFPRLYRLLTGRLKGGQSVPLGESHTKITKIVRTDNGYEVIEHRG